MQRAWEYMQMVSSLEWSTFNKYYFILKEFCDSWNPRSFHSWYKEILIPKTMVAAEWAVLTSQPTVECLDSLAGHHRFFNHIHRESQTCIQLQSPTLGIQGCRMHSPQSLYHHQFNLRSPTLCSRPVVGNWRMWVSNSGLQELEYKL